MIYTYVINRNGRGVVSQIDNFLLFLPQQATT